MAHRSRWLIVGGLLGLAAGVRIAAMFYQNISGDDATVALMAKHILSGEDLPVFFYRQAFIGVAERRPHGAGAYVFGPSVLLVRLNAVAWSLLFPLGLYVLARRLYDEAAARVTLVLAAVPPFLLTYYSTVAEPHFETNTFGVILLLLGLGALTATAEARRARALGVLGFVGGLAWWTNAKAVVVLGPILLGLLIQDPRLPGRRGGWLLGAGLAVGSLPAWLFYLTRPDPGPGNLGSARRFLEASIDLSWPRVWEFVTGVLPLAVGSYYWEPTSPQRRAALVAACVLHVAAIAVAGVAAVRALRGGGPARRAWGLWLLLATLVATYVALYVSTFNLLRQMSRGRYVLTAYIPLLVFLGAAIARLGRRSRLAAGVVLAAILAFHLSTNLVYLWPLWPAERARRAVELATHEELGRRLRDKGSEAILVDDPMESIRWQFFLTGARLRTDDGGLPTVGEPRRCGGARSRSWSTRPRARVPTTSGWRRSSSCSAPTPTVTRSAASWRYEKPAGFRRGPTGWCPGRLAGARRAPLPLGRRRRRSSARPGRPGASTGRRWGAGSGPRRAPGRGAPRALAHGLDRRHRAAGDLGIDRRGGVASGSGVGSGAGGAPGLRRGGPPRVPPAKRLARAGDFAPHGPSGTSGWPRRGPARSGWGGRAVRVRSARRAGRRGEARHGRPAAAPSGPG